MEVLHIFELHGLSFSRLLCAVASPAAEADGSDQRGAGQRAKHGSQNEGASARWITERHALGGGWASDAGRVERACWWSGWKQHVKVPNIFVRYSSLICCHVA